MKTYTVLGGEPQGKKQYENPGVDGKVILKYSEKSGFEGVD